MAKLLTGDIGANLKLLIQIVAIVGSGAGMYYGITGKLDVLEERLGSFQSSIVDLNERVKFLERQRRN